jgi:hypothetical protein
MNTLHVTPRRPKRWLAILASGLLPALWAWAAPAPAAEPGLPRAAGVLFADWSFSWDWLLSQVTSQERLLQIGAVGMCIALYIITRGKWR